MTAQETTATTETTTTTARSAETTSTGPHISIKPEPVFTIAGFTVTNSLLLSFVVLAFFIAIVAKYNADARQAKKSMFFYFITFAMRSIYDLFKSGLGDKTEYFFPLVGSFFFYILLNNWSGLIPGVGSITYHHEPLFRANTADLSATLALALISVTMVQYYGITHLGLAKYASKFINFTNPVAFFVGILEIVSELSRILSFAFRLFGNVFAGEVLLTVVSYLIPVLASLPFFLLETFVGFIQAIVFSMLSAILFRLSISHDH